MMQRKLKKHRPILAGVFFVLLPSVCLSSPSVLESFEAFAEHKDAILASEQSLAVDGFQMFPLGVELNPKATDDDLQQSIAIETAALFTAQLKALTSEICRAANTRVRPDQSIKVTGLPMQMVHNDRTRKRFVKVLSTPRQALEAALSRYCEPY